MQSNELDSDEITKLIAKARMAKMNGFSCLTLKFADYRIVALKVEFDTPKEELNKLYKNQLTQGTSGLRIVSS